MTFVQNSYVNQNSSFYMVRQCRLKHKGCLLKRPLSGRVVPSFQIQVPKAKKWTKERLYRGE